jgi:hypothetical protein
VVKADDWCGDSEWGVHSGNPCEHCGAVKIETSGLYEVSWQLKPPVTIDPAAGAVEDPTPPIEWTVEAETPDGEPVAVNISARPNTP